MSGSRCDLFTTQPSAFSNLPAPVGGREPDFRTSGRSLTPNRPPSDQIEGRSRRIRPRRWTHDSHENVNKSEGPDKCPGLLVNQAVRDAGGTKPTGLFVLFGLLFRRRQAFETLQEFLLGHPLDGYIGVVGVDAGAGRPDQRHGIGLGFVDFDELLQ